jgi:hypothetical protein
MHPIKSFLENQPPSDNNAEVEHIACKSKQYHLIDGILFQRGANGMMMKYITRGGHSIALGYSQGNMRITFIMAFNHRQSL